MTNKQTVTRFIGKCPVCEGTYKLTADKRMVHHGYERPGWGHIVGDCFAVGYESYEVSCLATEKYLAQVRALLAARLETLGNLKSGRTKKLSVTIWRGGKRDSEEIGPKDPRWERTRENAISDLAREVEQIRKEITRLTGLIDAWAPQALRTVEELEGLNAAERKAKSDKRAQDKAAKVQAKVESYQKRLATAIKNKTASTIADIFDSAQRQLRDMTGCTRAEAFAMLDRNNVFLAFGLDLTRDDHYSGPNSDVISRMRYTKKSDFDWPKDL